MSSTGINRVLVAVALALLIGSMGGCARPNIYPWDGWVTDDDTTVYGQDCTVDPWVGAPPPLQSPLPKKVELESATRCVYDLQIVPGDGEWLVKTMQETSGDLSGLAYVLRLPSESGMGQACPAVYIPPVIITVTDSNGRDYSPLVPVTQCGAPLSQVTAVIDALDWVDIGTDMVRQTRSELEVTSGCDGAWKPMVPLMADGSGTQTASIDATPRALLMCRYDLDPDPTNDIPDSSGLPHHVGKLASASTIDATAGGQLLAAVASAPRAVACDKPDAPFAVLHPVDGSAPYLAIELGGCYRVFVDAENYLRQLDAKVVDGLMG